MTDIDPELADAVVPEDAAAVTPADDAPVPRKTPARQPSSIGVLSLETILERSMKDRDMDSETKDLVSGCIKSIDSDHDGRVDHFELANFAINLVEQVQKLEKKNFSLKLWFQIAVMVCVFLVLSTFASSTAAVFMAKDMHVDNGALVTKDNQAIKTTTNEAEATVGALAFLPDDARKHVKSITFRGDGSGDEVVYEKLVGSIVVHPKKSVVITTTEGDTLKWSLTDNKDEIKITLAGGESWMMLSGCEKCTILNFRVDEGVTDALDEYHETIGTVLHENGRVLHTQGQDSSHNGMFGHKRACGWVHADGYWIGTHKETKPEENSRREDIEWYGNHDWAELGDFYPKIQSAYAVLGYNEELWNDEDFKLEKDWVDLTEEERYAAQSIKYDQEVWDNP